jgi:hypothetical protein
MVRPRPRTVRPRPRTVRPRGQGLSPRRGRGKILTPSLARRAEFCFDANGDYYFVVGGGGGGGGYGILLPDESLYEYVLGLLNSRLLDWYLQQITTPFHSGWFAYSKAYIEQIPLKIPETASEKQLAEGIAHSVRAILSAKAAQQNPALSDGEQRRHAATVETHEARIDQAILQLYGVEALP